MYPALLHFFGRAGGAVVLNVEEQGQHCVILTDIRAYIEFLILMGRSGKLHYAFPNKVPTFCRQHATTIRGGTRVQQGVHPCTDQMHKNIDETMNRLKGMCTK